ncbi:MULTISPECIES: hypothetical protein [Desulfococcus]|jgi:hypothetical protein|uniref:Uncharacterized protein n=1 Tax=Desulfococcus multivorans DSM 2059 TaxID=1121405 RepID=S7V4W9_DESML|nr:hypothetical protein [Desulfococcus multivorans]AOY60617.1 uncharacterized protein Dmul_38490 [Desulfococcus multivorans]AQV02708.1 hypothetical protein B2D07_19290 [Desulfococcus multivorans]EPR39673.1 hypothetical protein dsmv_2521 [Desulfococcus multivorans DSM 2059]MDX9819293.1 hypothetical protein [Desulfococcus multivorans]SKA03801.1 hypothetical protein SAMN02745446_02505 [Desulfococcus multivorans DSM 2059]
MPKAVQKLETYYTGNCRSEYLILRDILALDNLPILQRKKDPDDQLRLKSPLKPQGLCLNCDDRHICRHPSFGRNVVYCESYI